MTSLRGFLGATVCFFCIQGFGSDRDPIVRVKFLSLSFPISIEGQGLTIKGVKSPNLLNISIPSGKSKIEVDLKTIGRHKIWFIRKEEGLDRLSQKFLEISSYDSKIRIGGFEVPTPLLISPEGEVVSALSIDSYLQGVLAGEMPVNWPMEALKAQVIAARTYTLYQVNEIESKLYHVQAGILDQAFSSAVTPAQRERIRSAIEMSHHLVMVRQGAVIKAYYHADCGGQTEDPDYVWGRGTKKRNLQSVPDVQCALNSQSKWSLAIPLDEIVEKLDSLHPKIVDIKNVRIVSRTPSGRVALLAFSDSAKNEILISGNELRSLMGFMRLKSTAFDLTLSEDSLVFNGRGFGHGSGLCQVGAKFLAEKGATVKEILKHYYPSVSFSDLHAAYH